MSQFSLKYRPQTLEDMVVGNPEVLLKAKALVKTAQAVLITGPSGCGKTTMGLILNRMLNGEYAKAALIEENCSENRGLDAIRDIQVKLSYMSPGAKTVVLLDEVHGLTSQAASALLKLIESPPHSKVLFILCTDQPYRLLGSMVNRCRPLDIQPPQPMDLARYLYRVARRQRIPNVTKKALQTVCKLVPRAANCIPRLSMQLLEDACDLLLEGMDVTEIKSVIYKNEDANTDKFVGSVLLALYSAASGQLESPDDAALYILENMPTDAMGFLVRLQSANYYGAQMIAGGKFAWQGKIMVEAMKAKKMKPALFDTIRVSKALNDVREQLREMVTSPDILIGTGIAHLVYDVYRPKRK